MASAKEIVKSTNSLLLGSEIGQQDHVLAFWKEIEWLEHKQQVLKADCEVSRTGDAYINLYPSLADARDAGRQVLREFGLFLLAKGGARAKNIWEKKLTTPEPAHIDLFVDKLKSAELRQTCKTYDDVVATYPEKGHAVPRLIAIHLANALRLHNIPFVDSVGVDIKTWGPTTEFCQGKKYYSLLPLCAYAPRDICVDFGKAFADLIVSGLDSVIEMSTRYEFKKVIRRVIQRSA
jgi:hypothetical protein